jgi:hypothetical protein
MESLWRTGTPRITGTPFAPGSRSDVVVVGAGLPGLATALMLQRAGRTVTVIEAGEVAQLATGGNTGKLSLLQGSVLSTLRRHHYAALVKAYVDANRAGMEWLTGFAEEAGVPFTRRTAYSYAQTDAAASTVDDEFDAAREAGLDVAATRWVRDLSTAMLIELYEGGLGDAIILDLLSAKELVAAGHGTIVFRHLDAGVMTNSVYYCLTERVEELGDRTARFMDAIATAMEKINAGTATDEIETVLTQRFADRDRGLLREAASEMAVGGVWDTTVIDPEGSDRWMRILTEAGLIVRAPSLAELTGARPVGASS